MHAHSWHPEWSELANGIERSRTGIPPAEIPPLRSFLASVGMTGVRGKLFPLGMTVEVAGSSFMKTAGTLVEAGSMEHFVQYHNIEKFGHGRGDGDPFRIFAVKSVRRLPGNTVWLIAGEGRPRHYSLSKVFVVDEIGHVDVDGFRFFARGRHGTQFEPPIPLAEEAWFPGFLRYMQNFRYGLTRIPDEFLPHFQALQEDAAFGN